VKVTGTRRGPRYEIEINDQGQGMTAEQRANVAPFTQFGRNEHEQQGLGLGLVIARAVVELGGGTLCLETGPSQRGLTAVLDLPCS
jgi:signal transduction histidine kinase